MRIVLFEDEHVENLFPITIGRAAYNISCASFRWIDLLRELQLPIRAIVRPHLQELQRIDEPELAAAADESGPFVLVNARIAPSTQALAVVRSLLREGAPAKIESGAAIAAALPPADAAAPPSQLRVSQIRDFLSYSGASQLPAVEASLPLFEHPHDVVRYNLEFFADSIARRLEQGDFVEVADGVFAAEGATLGQHVVTDSSDGPILLDRGAKVGPYCLLTGPAYLGPSSRVIEHSAIKDAVSLGHTTKIGGEVEASVVEPYTNKQHHGFIGHSYLGSWINLGAGTCNSDLKNTYGEVKMEYRGRKVSTGMQFLGCIMGDYAKSAINTGIFTGKTIGACSMVYGFVTTNVPSFVNYARLFGQVTESPPEVMVATQQRMFARRNVAQRPCDIQLLHDMYEITRHERQLAGEPLSL